MRRTLHRMDSQTLGTLDAVATAAAVREGHVSAREVVQAALARIEERNGPVNAFTVVRAQAALAEADEVDAVGPRADRPLAGVPVVVKEEYDVTGDVTSLGGSGNSTPRTADSEVVRRLRAAGAVIVGRTTMPEFGQFPFTESVATGVTRNPFDLDRSPGGSSGGSAVAVATGMVPVALGADGGGSIRIPASACGLVGLKPTRGRVSVAPLSQHWYGLVVLGGMSRSVRDSALLLDVISGSTPVDRWSVPPPREPFATMAAREPGTLRIAWSTKSVTPGVDTDPEITAATEQVARALVRLGHRVHRTAPRWPVATDAFLPQFYGGMAAEAGQVEHPERLEPRTRQTARLARWATPRVVERAIRRGERVAAAVDARLLTDADVFLLPTMPKLPPPVGLLDGMDAVRAQVATLPYVANTVLTNVSGHPALSLPAGLSVTGLPIGVQLIARRGEEGLLLAVAAQLEASRPDFWPGVATP
ncbi:amidase [Ornithinibacter aureus]|uniref:Amidase n=2 Tax=Ornithinibacter aureus TaxID=622664 RepID=A0ABP8JS39_9MICO|nr:amidase [Ornithinibacter aureus]